VSTIYCFTIVINSKYCGYPHYHLLIVYRHPYLFSSTGRLPLLKLSSNKPTLTMVNRLVHAYLLTVVFHSSRAISIQRTISRTIFK